MKKIFSIFLVVCLLCSLSVSAFAYKLVPSIDTDKAYITIASLDGNNYAFCFDSYRISNGQLSLDNIDNYTFINNSWVYEYSASVLTVNMEALEKSTIHYDDTGLFCVPFEDQWAFIDLPTFSDEFCGTFEVLKKQISHITIIEIFVILIGATVGFAFMWWGVRKLVRAIMSAFMKGRVSI